MKKLAALFAATLSGALTLTAATPVAVWDGDFGTSAKTGTDGKTYTLVLPSGSESWVQADGTLKIGSGSQGAYINLQDGETYNLAQGTKISVLMEYENATALSVVASPIYLQADSYFGLKTKASSLEVVGDNWGVTYPTSSNTVTTLPAAGNMLMVYPQGSGDMKIYSAATRSGLSASSSGGEITGLRFSNKRLQKIGIGGCFTSGAEKDLNNFENLIIKKVAVFASAITATDATEYVFPSEIQTINVSAADSIAVSEINNQIDANTYKAVKVVAEDGATITVDEAFSTALPIAVSSTGSITLSAASQPDLSGVSFDVQGALLRSWLTPGVVGFNFNNDSGGNTSAALAVGSWKLDANSASGSRTDFFADGLSTLAWASGGTWAAGSGSILSGYLDDGAKNGNGAEVYLSNVPYETYDVIIYCNSDSNPGQFLAKTVNGTTYTWDSSSSSVVEGNAAWGKTALSTPVYGVNALRIKNLSGPLTIYGTARNGSNRGGIAAFQIMPPNTPDNIPTYTLTLSGAATTWSGGAWTLNSQTVDAPASGYVEIVASASTALTVDQAVSLTDLKVRGGENIVVNIATNDTGSLYAIRATVESGVFQQGSPAVLGTTPSIVVASGATFDENGMAINAANAVTIAGAGAGNWPWALTSSSGAGGAILGGLYLSSDATIGGANELKVGQTQAGYYCYLNGYTLTKVGDGAFTCTNMNTPGTGTIDLQGGAMSVNQWNNLNSASGNTVLTIRDGASFSQNSSSHQVAVQTLNYLGGTLTTSNPLYVKSAFTGSGSTAKLVFSDGVSATLSGDLTVTTAFTLNGSASFAKAQDATGDVTVTPSGTFTTSSSGTIAVGTGVVFNLGTARPAASFTVDGEGTLVVQKSSATDVPVVNVSAEPENVVFKDENGTEIESPKLVYDSEAGTLTFYAGNIWTATDGTAFDTPANWSSGVAPSSGESATLQILGDTEITVAGTYTLDALVVSGAGEVTFTGAGSVAAANILLENGATLKRDGATISATTGISLASGTVLKLDGVTESAVISGTGAVETYGNVTMATNNTYTGGTTVKTGKLSSTMPWGYGPFTTGMACSEQSCVTVEDGACVSLDNIINVANAYRLVIAGKGLARQDGTYSGAVVYTQGACGSTSRQISSVTLASDALVDLGNGWGLVHHSYGTANLALAGHTLTVRGTGSSVFPMQNVTALSSGTIVVENATLQLAANNYGRVSNLTNVNIVAKGATSIDFTSTATAIGSLTLKPSASGTTASSWNLPSGCVPTLDTSNVDPSGLTVGQVLTLFTAPSDTELTSETISVEAGSRYTIEISGNTVKATVKAIAPFLHYDFNGEATLAGAKASDSVYEIPSYGNYWPSKIVAKNGYAALIDSGHVPWWNENSANVSPLHAGEMSVLALIRPKTIDSTVRTVWNLGSALENGIALVVKDSSTLALVGWTNGGSGFDIAVVSGIERLEGKWHFVAIVTSENGTLLYVDDMVAFSETVVPQGIAQKGQFGSVHSNGNSKGYYGQNDAGFLLDDWRVYDVALTAKEIKALKRELNPDPLFIRLR